MSLLFSQAVQAHQSGRIAEAESLYRQIIAGDPKNFDALHMLGIVCSGSGKYEDADRCFRAALAIDSNFPPCYVNYGFCLLKQRRFDEAIDSFDKALVLFPNFGEAWLGRGNACRGLKRYDDAFVAYNKATTLNPNLAEAYAGRGDIFAALKRYDEALAAYDKALSIKTDLADGWLGRGNVFIALKRYDEALMSFDKALSIDTGLAEAWHGRGNVFAELNQYDKAFDSYDRALSIKPDLAAVYTSQGHILRALMRNSEALEAVNKAVKLDSADPQAHFNRSLILLALGKYSEGWDEFEWRKKLSQSYGLRRSDRPLLSSLEDAKGATVFLYGEQGLGDTIQFARYATLVSDKGGKVVLEAPKSLFALFKTMGGVSQLIAAGDPIPPFDYHCPLMSLPRIFRTTSENLPNKVPYLLADPHKAQTWAKRLGNKSKLRVGLVWSGEGRSDVTAVPPRRNIPLSKFAPLKECNAEFFSLQKGDAAVLELKALQSSGWNGPDIIDWTEEFDDFSSTAALIENLDLVISVDTSTAHLGGAMAKPVWLLNRFDIEWRWCSASPWYPTLKQYRQKESDNWDDVISDIRADLAGKIEADR